jgi:hypothetical protein
MKQALTFALTAALGVAATSALGADRHLDDSALIVTASNTASNQLMVYDTKGTLLSAIPTEGQGGVSGNAGGIASDRGRLAVVNFGSGSVSLFSYDLGHRTIRLDQVVQALGSPVSVALAHDHLYILTTTSVESHAFRPRGVAESADGAAALLHADGTAAQVGVVDDRLVLTEKSNAIETVRLNASGAINGTATLVTNIPANVNAPFGLATRGNDAYSFPILEYWRRFEYCRLLRGFGHGSEYNTPLTAIYGNGSLSNSTKQPHERANVPPQERTAVASHP